MARAAAADTRPLGLGYWVGLCSLLPERRPEIGQKVPLKILLFPKRPRGPFDLDLIICNANQCQPFPKIPFFAARPGFCLFRWNEASGKQCLQWNFTSVYQIVLSCDQKVLEYSCEQFLKHLTKLDGSFNHQCHIFKRRTWTIATFQLMMSV